MIIDLMTVIEGTMRRFSGKYSFLKHCRNYSKKKKKKNREDFCVVVSEILMNLYPLQVPNSCYELLKQFVILLMVFGK